MGRTALFALTLAIAAVGRAIFFDAGLSEPAGQSCASCHAPERGFSDPRPGPTSEGAIAGRFGARNAPTAAYAIFAPRLRYDRNVGSYAGGLFLDGRVDSLEEHAQGPPLNPFEMHNPDRAAYVAKVAVRPYAADLKAIYGEALFADVDRAFAAITEAVAAFERSAEVSPFTSKYDAYLHGTATLTAQERRGAGSVGKFKVPTLRNVARTAPYMHNGVFASLKEVVAFYNRRDLDPARFGPPEVSQNVNREELGHLGLSDAEEDALVAFLNTLSDGTTHP